ncbi:DUF1212-domain-containing protein [Zopfia rhizophila CBS 207.26]|uniref:DUF1212-domain-containing protein n=1 Tax=Zopfia rhizophila CBS 207.26 TaxID=1314779 RepID=A0A6A6ENV2_9PEZI|nr:DUF1212-domain-containing protein [Zopfia rhizophila CBS 207.26]
MTPTGRKRVGFTSDAAPPDDTPTQSHPPEESPDGNEPPFPSLRPDVSHEELSVEIHKAFGQPYIPKPRPAIRRTTRTSPQILIDDEAEHDDNDDNEQKRKSGIAAQQRATRLARSVGTLSTSSPGSRRNSFDGLLSTPPIENVPLRNTGIETPGDTTDEDEGPDASTAKKEFLEADKLVRTYTRHHSSRSAPIFRPEEELYHSDGALQSGQATPINEVEIEDEHVPRPSKFRTGVLGTLLKASRASAPHPAARNTKVTGHGRNPSSGSITFSDASTAANTPTSSPPTSGANTPMHPHDHGRHWYSKSANASSATISQLIESSSMMATPGQKDMGHEMAEKYKKTRPGLGKRSKSSTSVASAFNKLSKSSRDEQIKIKIHLAGTLARQTYLRKLCKALMMYGAPTHRLEEYMNMSARVLEIEAQFLYIPGCMIISFDDSSVHTTEVKLVRTSQGIDLGKLRDVHEIYKDVVHDRIGVEEATPRLEAIISRKPKFDKWLRVPVYGLASATVGPFAFQARPIDLPFCFILGCFLGWLQLVVAPGNDMISNVFEISAAVITSFVARGIGSIKQDGKEIFCFSAMAQSSIALILPGFTVLSASLELQSKHIVAGSVRMVYAIIYSLFLGFGITIGTALFGMMYKDATSATSCTDPMKSHWYYFFVLAFSLCLMIINQAKYKQIPAMLVIALIGYVINYHSSQYFKGNAQVSNTLGAFAIGVSANLHARFGRFIENWGLDIWETHLRPRWRRIRKKLQRARHGRIWSLKSQTSHEPNIHDRTNSVASSSSHIYIPRTRKIGYGLAAATMLPAIFVQVPSGLSVNGSLVSGITSADQITRNITGITTVSSGTDASSNVNQVALNVGFSVIQVAIGITVGLFLAALLVYPLGKKRSGLFSF